MKKTGVSRWVFPKTDSFEAIYPSYIEETIKLASFPLWQQVRIEDLRPSRGSVQRAYKEMKRDNFPSNLIDYLCWICMGFVVHKTIGAAKITGSEESLSKKQIKEIDSLISAVTKLYPECTKNLIRLYVKPMGVKKISLWYAVDSWFKEKGVTNYKLRDEILREIDNLIIERTKIMMKYE